jgi:hypothetical protein
MDRYDLQSGQRVFAACNEAYDHIVDCYGHAYREDGWTVVELDSGKILRLRPGTLGVNPVDDEGRLDPCTEVAW